MMRIRVNGKRFNRISCVNELMLTPNHPSEAYRELYQAVIDAAGKVDDRAYRRYVKECNRENLNAHDRHMWEIHGKPTGPI